MKIFKYFLLIILLNSCKDSSNSKELMEKRMIEIADSVYNSRTNQTSNNEMNNNTITQLLGYWVWEEANGNFFGLTFSENNEATYEAIYEAYRMPFEEALTLKQNGNIIELYYKGISDSSFEKNNNKFECKELVARINIEATNKISVEVINDNCSNMQKGRFILFKK